MRKIIVGLLVAFAGLALLAAPAAAQVAKPSKALVSCPGSKSQTDDGITVRVYYVPYGNNCQVNHVQAWSAQGSKYGHFNLFGPYGWSDNSPTKSWGWGEPYDSYPWAIAWPGHLWCAKFYDGNNQPVTGNVCVTI
ncbi:hypothetical protein [Streptosporangium carneum]|uniref:Secreted protein n=1 Tax=Streptosporangium carneum TaxID=47481 RepID=A0A9W6MET1_9ACTN|nr:hypothetical protein [Streptosporangium carneum]GLK11919.1 hypothetical protein GCM10017600_53270 [Streptosporangium carneum]